MDFSVRNIPSIEQRKIKYRTKISSHELNSIQKEASDDILDLFNKANQMQRTLYEIKMINGIEENSYSLKLQDIMLKQKQLEEAYEQLKSNNINKYLTAYAYTATSDNDYYKAMIDPTTGTITAKIASSVSKVRLYDETYDEYLVAPSLSVMLGPDTFVVGDKILSIEDNDILNAFDGNSSTSWVRKVITTSDVQEIENEIIIGLPEDIITSRLVNQIEIHPFPIGYVDITGVEYKFNGSWNPIPGFTTYNGCIEGKKENIFGDKDKVYNSINDAPNIKLNFQPLETNQIKIKLRQRKPQQDVENNRLVWYLGLKDVNISYNIYTRDYSEFDLLFDFPFKDKNIKVIDSEVLFNNPDLTDDKNFSVSQEYLYFDSDGNTHKVTDNKPFVINSQAPYFNQMVVRCKIDGLQVTPNIYGVKVKYTVNDMLEE